MTAPEWLTRRRGGLERGSAGSCWYVLFNGEPVYTLRPRPVDGKFGCVVMHTNSGRPLDSQSTAASADDAIVAGLEDLRKTLGW